MQEEEIILVVDPGITLRSTQTITPVNGLLLEHNVYQRFGDTKLYYRIDKGNNAIGQQRHIHVFKDRYGKIQLFAINYDGTPHDGSKYVLTKIMQEALQELGIPVPPNGILEWEEPAFGQQMLFD